MNKREEAISKEKALRLSIFEGSNDKISFGFGHAFITNFALALKATSFDIGILSSLSSLLPQIVQPWGNRLMEKKTRRDIVLNYIFLEALLWLPLALVGFLYWKDYISKFAIILTLIIYPLINVCRGVYFPAWFSWMGDLVPENKRGAYFSKRDLIIGIVEFALTLIGIGIISIFEQKSLLLIGLAILFFLSSLSRIGSIIFISRQYEPRFVLKKSSEFSFFDFIKKYDNFGKFAVYQGVFYFALMIASPFFMVYMVERLNFSNWLAVGILMSGSVIALIFLPVMGRLSDRYGNKLLFIIANVCFALSPLSWLVSNNLYYLATIPNIISGIANAALLIAATNFIYNTVTPKHRGICASYTNIMIGIGTFIGSLMGGFILSYVSFTSFNIFFAVFILSALLRGIVAIYFLPKLKEGKEFEKVRIPSFSLTNSIKHFHFGFTSHIFHKPKIPRWIANT